jgi:hypothetical protein
MRATITPHAEGAEKPVSIEQIPKYARTEFRSFEKLARSSDISTKLPKYDSGTGFKKILGHFYWVSVIQPNGAKLSRELLRLEGGPCVVKVFGQSQRIVHEYDAEKCFDANSILLPTPEESTISSRKKFWQAKRSAVKCINDPEYSAAFDLIMLGTGIKDGTLYMYVENAPIALERKILRVMNVIEGIYGSIQLNSSIETMLRYVARTNVQLRR